MANSFKKFYEKKLIIYILNILTRSVMLKWILNMEDQPRDMTAAWFENILFTGNMFDISSRTRSRLVLKNLRPYFGDWFGISSTGWQNSVETETASAFYHWFQRQFDKRWTYFIKYICLIWNSKLFCFARFSDGGDESSKYTDPDFWTKTIQFFFVWNVIF